MFIASRQPPAASFPSSRRRLAPFLLALGLAGPFFTPAAAHAVNFVRGDTDASGELNLTDAILILRYLFVGDAQLTCLDAADANDNGGEELTDAISLLDYLFRGGAVPPAPHPDCGPDPTRDDSTCIAFLPCGVTVDSGLDERPPSGNCAVLDRPATHSGVKLERVFPNVPLIGILGLYQAPGDDTRWFVARKPGFLYWFRNDPAVRTRTTFLDISGRVASTAEGGILGVAFHPDFAENGQVFLFYTSVGAPLIVNISRFTSADGGQTLDPASEVKLLTVDQLSEIHHGGALAFGPDRYLYIGLGDSGVGRNAADTSTLLGSILRLDVDGGSPYGIPPGNPFAAGGGRPEIYAWGVRQPWRATFDRLTGDLWLGDVGRDLWEEVDKIVLGGNFGWPTREGAHCTHPTGCEATGLIDPIVEYSHDEGSCVIGGYVYRGSAIPELSGVYIYGDWGNGRIWGLFPGEGGKLAPRLLVETGLRVMSFGEGHDGELYFVDGGTIQKLVPDTDPAPDTFPTRLSQTGFVNPANPAEPAPCLIPYDLNVPFWSDGAEKERYVFVPEGETIHAGADGDWELPVGSVLVKHFRLEGKLIETRLFMHHRDGDWGGYSYEWDDAQTDATLLPGDKTKLIGTTTWTYPNRSQCLQCHSQAAGRALGLEHAQMNRDLTYPTTDRTANQLATFTHIGLLDEPLPAPPDEMPALAPIADGTKSIDERARSYLHSNCSHCHRPDGGGRGPADLRYQVPFQDLGVCNVGPTGSDLGVPGSVLLAPGNTSLSLMSLRMHATDSVRMPPIARNHVDLEGVALVDAWIAGITGCDEGGIIIDNGEPGTSFRGNWGPSDAPNAYGSDSVYSRAEGATYTYTFNLPQSGAYVVSVWWTVWPSRVRAVPIAITHAGGTETVTVDQRANGGKWNLMGSWEFVDRATITITSTSASGSTSADAVRLIAR